MEALFESVRKQVKHEVETLLPQPGTENLPNKTGQTGEKPSPPPTTGPAPKKHDDTRLMQSPTTAAAPSLKAEQKDETPVADQPVNPPDCTPEPPQLGQNQREKQLSRLASMKNALCFGGKFQGLVSKRWLGLKTQIENATTSHEQLRIADDIDLFAKEFIYDDQNWLAAERREAERREAEQQDAERREAERQEAERQEAERQEAERRELERAKLKKNAREAANLDTSRCQPAVSVACEQLMKRLRSLQVTLLRTDPPSRQTSLRELSMIGQELRAARSKEELQEAAHALDSWQQRQFPP